MDESKLLEMSIAELRQMAKEMGVHSPTTLRKQALVDAMLAAEKGGEEPMRRSARKRAEAPSRSPKGRPRKPAKAGDYADEDYFTPLPSGRRDAAGEENAREADEEGAEESSRRSRGRGETPHTDTGYQYKPRRTYGNQQRATSAGRVSAAGGYQQGGTSAAISAQRLATGNQGYNNGGYQRND